jgi:hypothetical protein
MTIKPPQTRGQTSIRMAPNLFEALEERALEESMRLGVSIKLADLIRRGAQLVLSEPLPGQPARVRRCKVVPTVNDGKTCLECKMTWTSRATEPVCPRDGRAVISE